MLLGKFKKRFIVTLLFIMISYLVALLIAPMLVFTTQKVFYHSLDSTNDLFTNFSNIAVTSVSTSAPSYLWCLNYHGPNNQLKGIIKCSLIAATNNFTLVIPPLFPHYQDKTQGIQSFQDFYEVERLAAIVNFVTFESFLEKVETDDGKLMIDCNVIQIGLPHWVPYHVGITFRPIEKHYQTKIDFKRFLNLSSSAKLEDIHKVVDRCSSIFLQSDYLAFGHLLTAQHIHVQRIFRHLHRNAIIRRMASHMIDLLPQLARANQFRNNHTSLAVAHLRLGDRVVLSLPMYTMQISKLIQNGIYFTHLHVMCPYLTSTDIDYLISSIPISITTTEILSKNANFTLDDYLFDVLEQEIAMQAEIFIASPWTTYSSTVVLQKLNQNMGAVYTFTDTGMNRTLPVTVSNATYYFR